MTIVMRMLMWRSGVTTFVVRGAYGKELAAGLEEMRTRNTSGELTFPDRFAFVTGQRS